MQTPGSHVVLPSDSGLAQVLGAVWDGHMGAECAKFASTHFHSVLLDTLDGAERGPPEHDGGSDAAAAHDSVVQEAMRGAILDTEREYSRVAHKQALESKDNTWLLAGCVGIAALREFRRPA